jgi:uncharacterized protein YecT (DUF1311 family)
MKRIALSLLALCGLLLIVSAAARTRQRPSNPCENATTNFTQFESTQCARKQYLAADAALNKAYAKLIATLDDAEERAKLKDAEQAWIKYRDANCEYEAFFYRGGTMRPMIQSLCHARVTDARAAELKQQLELLEQ